MNAFARADIVRSCLAATGNDVLDEVPYGRKIVKLNDKLVVKCGYGVFEQEKYNLNKTHSILDPTIVRVPRAYDYFQDSAGHGYLVMEFMRGHKQDYITDESHLKALRQILEHFAAQKSESPGPLGGGPSYSLIFGESDYPVFESVEAMDNWFSHRLLEPANRVCLSQFELVLCHLDLFPRNILWQAGEPPAIVDWCSAGYYPQILERCMIKILGRGEDEQLFQPMSPAEAEQSKLVLKVWSNTIRFSFSERSKSPDIFIDPDFEIPPPPSPPTLLFET